MGRKLPSGDCSCCGSSGCEDCGGDQSGYWLSSQDLDVSGVPDSIHATYNDPGSGMPAYDYDLSGWGAVNRTFEITRNGDCTWPTVTYEFELTGTVTEYGSPNVVDNGPFTGRIIVSPDYLLFGLVRPDPDIDVRMRYLLSSSEFYPTVYQNYCTDATISIGQIIQPLISVAFYLTVDFTKHLSAL